AEQTIDAPAPLATNSWQHVAVTLDGARGLIYLNGQPVATNNNVTIRPWQLLARTNFLGESQFAADPTFNGRLDSVRIFGRPLSGAEIRDLAYAHPTLAHRYSFTSNAWDSIGMAHGTLLGSAVVTNQALKLTGTTGGYVNLPGGLVSGSAAVTLEFWAAFGASGNWARVFDFGNISGANGSQYLYFSPHTSTGAPRLEISSGLTVNLELVGTLDNRTLHVACIIDPANGYRAVYTNGILAREQTGPLPALSAVHKSWSFIGRSLFSADSWLNATIDEFRIYDGRLTSAEIAANYQFGPDALALPVTLEHSNSTPNLILAWPSWAVGFNPEFATDLSPGTIWSSLSAASLGADRWAVVVPKTNAAKFFRLKRP
ncbi:MAG: LamG domain-containing protein, partial [Akkermansiaceae bacterium]|nr:LamG domain-containing protein [Verrucomicrobiales bacterium]